MERTVIYNSGTVFGLHESISIAYVWNGFERGLEAHFSTLLPLHHKNEASMFPVYLVQIFGFYLCSLCRSSWENFCQITTVQHALLASHSDQGKKIYFQKSWKQTFLISGMVEQGGRFGQFS